MDKYSVPEEPRPPPPPPAFFCHLCSISCMSALNLQSHFLGAKHRKVEEAVRNHLSTDKAKEQDKKEVLPTDAKPNITLQEHIDACKDSEAALGLEYVYQYEKAGQYTYDCKLCDCRAGLSIMFMHIVGAKHRITYLGKHHPELGIHGPYIMRGPKKLGKLREICLKVEKEFGRQKINVVEGMDSEPAGNPDTVISSANYTPYDNSDKADFTSDNYFDTDKPAEATEEVTQHVTFLELKTAYEESQKNALSVDNLDLVTEEEENDTEKKEDTEGESKKDTPEKQEGNKEPCKSDQGFKNSKELFNYLEHFSIVEEGDVKFVNSAIRMLTFALQRHRYGYKGKPLSTSEATTEQDKSEAQAPAPSNQGTPETQKQMPAAPVTQKQMPAAPVTQKQMPAAPVTQKQMPAAPVTQKQMPAAPVTQKQMPAAPVTQKQMPAAPVTQKQMPAASQYDNRKRTGEPQPSTSVQNSASSAPQGNKGTRFARTRFAPPQASFPSTQPQLPRPPLFPIGQDDVVGKFFESIKDMDVNEVASTLSRITATNPALKGVNVPNLIRYLSDTGKLKTTQSMHQMNQ